MTKDLKRISWFVLIVNLKSINPVCNNEEKGDNWDESLNGKFRIVFLRFGGDPWRFHGLLGGSLPFQLCFLDFPCHVDDEDDKGEDEAEEEPEVDQLEVGRRG